MGDLTGKTWFITGTGSGFGRAIAQQVLQRGGNVVASSRNPDSVADILALAPERVFAASLDVTSTQQIELAVSQAQERFGQIDVLVNNAGFGLLAAIEEASDAEVRHQFDVNVFGLAAVTRAVLPGMRAVGSGRIVNISSTAGTRGGAGVGYYAASKFAVEAISESLSREGEPLGIRVLIVEPGPFRTDFSGRSITVPTTPLAVYEHAARMRKYSSALDGNQPGDPKRAAKIIIDTVLAENPPLRLVLGGEAYRGAVQSIRERLIDMERSHNIAAQADFPK
ncbi:oxidoreductase [Pseudomonas fluorescens]|uniref:3-phenylpropionate-dihydrodiol/cinnamic acid-dihydrodiol dehydrogenase n=1 Tax=Pseudomonas fluorescens TaxID=294 RepID=A0A5E7BYM8_PSEFL|nr:oxidoreductase [Pseudomonas fluorescens]VVN97266.1 3-phenylpropionate-dihydrodiol/cinnamic acid-dihydrodiol dehydrogenase [Pseudomonas fluorescens]